MNTNEPPILKKYLPNRCLDIQTISCVWDGNKFNQLSVDTSASEVRCPMCGGRDGYYIPPGRGWSCLRQECLPKISKGKYIRPPLEMGAFCVPDDYQLASLERCDQPQEVINYFYRYAKLPRGFLVLTGRCGTGKTYAACAIIQEYRRHGDSCRFISATQIYSTWLEAAREGSVNNLLYSYDVELLVIDDLGVKASSDAFISFLYMIIDKRKKCEGTIITTNLDAKNMRADLGDRIFSRICSGKNLQLEGDDRRKLSRT